MPSAQDQFDLDAAVNDVAEAVGGEKASLPVGPHKVRVNFAQWGGGYNKDSLVLETRFTVTDSVVPGAARMQGRANVSLGIRKDLKEATALLAAGKGSQLTDAHMAALNTRDRGIATLKKVFGINKACLSPAKAGESAVPVTKADLEDVAATVKGAEVHVVRFEFQPQGETQLDGSPATRQGTRYCSQDEYDREVAKYEASLTA